jgi:hypothetical protein
MLNKKTNKRELAYVVRVDEVRDLPGYTNVHYIKILGWWCVASKQLRQGDKAIYFEIDSLLPKDDPRFSFMEKRKYRVKTLKICKVVSQGLVMPLSDFPELSKVKVNDFVTEKLKVSIYDPDSFKSTPRSKTSPFQKAMDRHKRFFNFPPVKFLMRFQCFRSLMAKLFVHKKDKISWPDWLPKTGSERIQNLPQLLGNGELYIATEKVDGCSSSYILDEKDTFFIGSHNVIVYSSKDKSSSSIADGNKYFKSNVWMEMGERYNLEERLFRIKMENRLKTIAIQGETFGDGIQKRTYSKTHNTHDFTVFHIFFNGVRLPIKQMVKVCEQYSLPHVHIYDLEYSLPNTVESILQDIDSRKSAIDGGDIEGFVFYTQDGQQNFKCVSPTYLLKYHQ